MDSLPLTRMRDARPAGTSDVERRSPFGRLGRIGLALALLAGTGLFLHDRFMIVQTQKAIMAGHSLTLRAPIEGRLDMPVHLPGAFFGHGAHVGSVVNERVDTQRLDEIRAMLESVEAEVTALVTRTEATRAFLAAAAGTADGFRRTRLEQLRARIAEGEALQGAALARLRDADGAAGRGEALLRQGFTSIAVVQALRRDLAVARDEATAATERLTSLRAEEEGAKLGIFAADNASDRSISQQNMDRLSLTLLEVETLLVERRARRDALRRQMDAEAARLTRLASALVETPEPALLTRLFVQPGEAVRPWQEIARLLSCATPLITAELDERHFRQVGIGRVAEFRPAGTSERIRAEVIQRVAPSFVPGEVRSPPQVVLRPLAPPTGCETGRLGSVHFL
jgi:hypothetical protein